MQVVFLSRMDSGQKTPVGSVLMQRHQTPKLPTPEAKAGFLSPEFNKSSLQWANAKVKEVYQAAGEGKLPRMEEGYPDSDQSHQSPNRRGSKNGLLLSTSCLGFQKGFCKGKGPFKEPAMSSNQYSVSCLSGFSRNQDGSSCSIQVVSSSRSLQGQGPILTVHQHSLITGFSQVQ